MGPDPGVPSEHEPKLEVFIGSDFISHDVLMKCLESQPPHKIVNLLFAISNIKAVIPPPPNAFSLSLSGGEGGGGHLNEAAFHLSRSHTALSLALPRSLSLALPRSLSLALPRALSPSHPGVAGEDEPELEILLGGTCQVRHPLSPFRSLSRGVRGGGAPRRGGVPSLSVAYSPFSRSLWLSPTLSLALTRGWRARTGQNSRSSSVVLARFGYPKAYRQERTWT